jgi:hypothetical protein
MRFQGTLDELRRRSRAAAPVSLRTTDNPRALQVLAGSVPGARIQDGAVLLPRLSDEQLGLVNRRLVCAGIDVHHLSAVAEDLETIFMKLVSPGHAH